MSQSGEIGQKVLTDIHEFLVSEGIKAYIHHVDWHNKQRVWNIYIYSLASLMKFLRSILPFARVKKVVVQDTLRFYTMYPALSTVMGREMISDIHLRHAERKKERIVKTEALRAIGKSVSEIAKELGWKEATIYKDIRLAKTKEKAHVA